jgi:hypothetical protein
MNCAACNRPINRFRGYYLVGDIPYCRKCYKGTDERRYIKYPIQPVAAEYEHDNLLEAFRAYQERDRKSLC